MTLNLKYPAFVKENFDFPEFFKVRLNYPRPRLKDKKELVRKIMDERLSRIPLKKGDRIAVAVGSRGIGQIGKIVGLICEEIRRKKASPFIAPAMGSHGGADAESQAMILKNLGVDEESCGCPVISSMEVRRIGRVFDGVPVYFSADALSADHTICVNRIKPHTKFKAPLESGVLKMLCVGLGKHSGASTYHKWALKRGFYPLLKKMGEEIARKSNFRFGIGIVENAYDEVMLIEGIDVRNLFSDEERLLKIARENMPRLPASRADVLVVKQLGKDVSGAGMDPNITGRAGDLMEDDFSSAFKASRIAVLNLTEASKGNALGIGNADIITEKALRAMDYRVTLTNIFTGLSLKKGAIPIIMPTDKAAAQACFATLGPVSPRDVRAIIIQDTLNISQCWLSRALRRDLRDDPGLTDLEKTSSLFDSDENLRLSF